MSRARQSLKQLGIVFAGLLLACVVIALCSDVPLTALKFFFTGPFSSAYEFGNMISYSIPLIITGLSASIAYSASVWNLGTEGQMFFGMLCGTWTAYMMSSFPALIAVPVSLIAAFAGGAVLTWLSVFLDKKFRVNIMLSTLLISNAIQYVVMFVIEGPFNDPKSASGVCTPKFNPAFMLPRFFGKSDLHAGLFIALALVVVVYWFLHHCRKGYEIMITGKNRNFARYGGINTGAVISLAMVLSGGLAGVGGMVDILGVHGKMRCMMTGFGWDGVSIAMISRNNPVLVLPIALIFAFMEKGVMAASLFADISPDVSQLIEAAILFFATIEFTVSTSRKAKKNARLAGAESGSGKEVRS